MSVVGLTPSPVKPGEHRQEKRPSLSSQVAPFLQGWDAHSFTSMWQRAPWNPGTQKQTYPSPRGLHMALFWHGFGEQGLTVGSRGPEVPPFEKQFVIHRTDITNIQFIQNFFFSL